MSRPFRPWTCVSLVCISLAIAGCGGGDDGASELTPPTTRASESNSVLTPVLTGNSVETLTDSVSTPGGTSEPSEDPGAFITRIIERRARGQHARVWEDMHPAHKSVVPRSLYVRCEDADEFGAELVDVKVLEVYDEPDEIPGQSGEVMSKAVTVEISANVPLLEGTQKDTDTAHAYPVDGEWKWVLTDEDWQAYSKGDCPPPD